MRVLLWKVSLLFCIAALVTFAINNSYIQTNPPNNVTNDNSIFHWEPSTAVGGTWVHSYAREDNYYSFTAVWTGAQWVKSTNPILGYCGPSCGDQFGDVYLGYDALHSQYVAVGTGFEVNSSSLYFRTSTDGLFTGAPL